MEQNQQQPAILNAFDLLRFIWKKKWLLGSLSLIACIFSIYISLKITPRFKSTAVVFPASSVSLSKSLIDNTYMTDGRDVMSLGSDEDEERLLQILHSNQIRDHVIRKFNLMQHYQIDTSSPYLITRLNNAYNGNVHIRRTEFMSVEISVLDPDPRMAADIANEITAYVDSVYQNMQHERALKAFELINNEYKASQREIQQITDSLKMKGRPAVSGAEYEKLSGELKVSVERQEMLKNKSAAYRINVDQTVPHLFVVDKAVPSDKKDVPKRSLIVLLTTLSTFAVALLLSIFVENYKSRS